ncbi:hypothetical protein WH47_07295 [Habropoda laboriosa]|uniref:Uncharacterized protein n=1 Tax=Habropoda laboriosa TaxID=597456 RepID=A0A0L7R633_9HYME|nr:hypothetical protein WH47_07295 [Habropoda laboriosa]
MCASIREFGFRIPIVAKSDGTVVDGHLRLKAARKLGMESIPVVLSDNLNEPQTKALRLLANQSANWAKWDDDLLKVEIQELEDLQESLEHLSSIETMTALYSSLVNSRLFKMPLFMSQTIDHPQRAFLIAQSMNRNTPGSYKWDSSGMEASTATRSQEELGDENVSRLHVSQIGRFGCVPLCGGSVPESVALRTFEGECQLRMAECSIEASMPK